MSTEITCEEEPTKLETGDEQDIHIYEGEKQALQLFLRKTLEFIPHGTKRREQSQSTRRSYEVHVQHARKHEQIQLKEKPVYSTSTADPKHSVVLSQ
jgi:hypothetical protein